MTRSTVLLFISFMKLCNPFSKVNMRRMNVTNNKRYLPFIASLVLMKLTVMMLLANSYKQHVGQQQHPNSLPVLLVPANTNTSTLIDEETRNFWHTLDHLEEAKIEPSGTNRTSKSSIWLVYNRVPRSGGLTLVHLLKELAEDNRFTHQRHQYRTPWTRLMIDDEMKNLVTWFEYQHEGKSYDRHFLYVNFTKYQRYAKNLHPTYINLVRDPVEREYSIFRSRRSQDPLQITQEIKRRDNISPGSGMEWYTKSFEDCILDDDPECSFNLTDNAFGHSIPYFCGQDPQCLVPGSRWALQRAKLVIEHEYAVVGILEDMKKTLQVLENYVPRFFSGASQAYYDARYARRHENSDIKAKPALSQQVLDKLKGSLSTEYELYHFCQQRLYHQYQKIVNN